MKKEYPQKGIKRMFITEACLLDLSCLLTSSKQALLLLSHVPNPAGCSIAGKKKKRGYIIYAPWNVVFASFKVHWKPFHATEVRLVLVCSSPGLLFFSVSDAGVMLALFQLHNPSLT